MARTSGFPGVGERIRERLVALGYERNGHPDIMRFCDERRYRSTYFYRWANYNMIPEKESLDRLAADLGVKPWWLLYGDVIYERNAPAKVAGRRSRPPVPIKGGAGALLPESPTARVPAASGTRPVRRQKGENTPYQNLAWMPAAA